eukprot:snap_masked-scaffold_18-processed-gene-0.37-mRNA-1 protein AED:1.00 eAED:1.00 QI:0/-1/0/0/-1/1/1/0/623
MAEDRFKDYELVPRNTFTKALSTTNARENTLETPDMPITPSKRKLNTAKETKQQEASLWKKILSASRTYLETESFQEGFKIHLAQLCQKIQQDPQKNSVPLPNDISNLEVLYELCKVKEESLKQLCILSLTLILSDILPDYKITSPAPTSTPLKKETKRLHNFERVLLNVHTKFVKLLMSVQKRRIDGHQKRETKFVCAKAMCTLLMSKPNFNSRQILVKAIVQLVAKKNEKISTLCASCLNTLLVEDQKGDITLEILNFVASSVTFYVTSGRSLKLNSLLFETTLQYNLKVDLKDEKLLEEVKKNRKKAKSKTQKKNEAFMKLQETKATVSFHERYERQAQGLRDLFVIYLRVIKAAEAENLINSACLNYVLKGIAKFGSLVHFDLLQELVSLLSTLLKNNRLQTQASLKAIYSTCLILQSSGREMSVQIDETGFMLSFLDIFSFENILVFLAEVNEEPELIGDVIDCTQVLFLQKLRQPKKRVLELVSKLSSLCLNLYQSHTVIGLLTLIENLISHYDLEQLYLSEREREEDLDWLPFSFGTPLWSLSNLSFSSHPTLKEVSRKLLKNSESEQKRAFTMYKNFDASDGKFKPYVRTPKIVEYTFASTKNKKKFTKFSPLIS